MGKSAAKILTKISCPAELAFRFASSWSKLREVMAARTAEGASVELARSQRCFNFRRNCVDTARADRAFAVVHCNSTSLSCL